MGKSAAAETGSSGLLFASGLITGEALIGIFLAIPVAIYQSSNVFAIVDQPFSGGVGLLVIGIVSYMLYAISKRS